MTWRPNGEFFICPPIRKKNHQWALLYCLSEIAENKCPTFLWDVCKFPYFLRGCFHLICFPAVVSRDLKVFCTSSSYTLQLRPYIFTSPCICELHLPPMCKGNHILLYFSSSPCGKLLVMAYLRVSSPGTEQLRKGVHVLEEQKRVAEMMQTMITPQLTLF